MKYWAGYLTAAIIGAISWAFMQMAQKFTTLVDMVFPYVLRILQDTLSEWSAGLDFCLWQMLAVAGGALVIATIVLMVVMRIYVIPMRCTAEPFIRHSESFV